MTTPNSAADQPAGRSSQPQYPTDAHHPAGISGACDRRSGPRTQTLTGVEKQIAGLVQPIGSYPRIRHAGHRSVRITCSRGDWQIADSWPSHGYQGLLAGVAEQRQAGPLSPCTASSQSDS
jgi:hypothetical protein